MHDGKSKFFKTKYWLESSDFFNGSKYFQFSKKWWLISFIFRKCSIVSVRSSKTGFHQKAGGPPAPPPTGALSQAPSAHGWQTLLPSLTHSIKKTCARQARRSNMKCFFTALSSTCLSEARNSWVCFAARVWWWHPQVTKAVGSHHHESHRCSSHVAHYCFCAISFKRQILSYYSGTLNNAGVRGTNPPNSLKSSYNSPKT